MKCTNINKLQIKILQNFKNNNALRFNFFRINNIIPISKQPQ